jgi:hypothetical protein
MRSATACSRTSNPAPQGRCCSGPDGASAPPDGEDT